LTRVYPEKRPLHGGVRIINLVALAMSQRENNFNNYINTVQLVSGSHKFNCSSRFAFRLPLSSTKETRLKRELYLLVLCEDTGNSGDVLCTLVTFLACSPPSIASHNRFSVTKLYNTCMIASPASESSLLDDGVSMLSRLPAYKLITQRKYEIPVF